MKTWESPEIHPRGAREEHTMLQGIALEHRNLKLLIVLRVNIAEMDDGQAEVGDNAWAGCQKLLEVRGEMGQHIVRLVIQTCFTTNFKKPCACDLAQKTVSPFVVV